MRKISFFALLLTLSFMTFISCDKTQPKPEDPAITGKHFDLWSQIGGNAGMGSGSFIVKSTPSLDTGEIDFLESGVDVSQIMNPNCVIKDKYYYFLSEEGKFGKYQITNNNVLVVKEIPFPILKDRRHTHAWIDDNTLLLMGSNGASDKILWAKVDTDNLSILSQGELDLPAPPTGQSFNTSGILAYRKSDNKALYFYKYNKKSGPTGTEPTPEFYAAFINQSNMTIEKIVTETRAEQMAGTAYGELRQSKSFFDEKGDYYLACNSVLPGEGTTTAQHGALLRIKNNEQDFDKSYNGYTLPRGKIVTLTYLNNGKALLYMQDPMHTTGNTTWSSTTNPYVFYYIIVDLNTLKIEELKDIPFGNGNFSQLSLLIGKKAYIAINPEVGKSKIYIYDTTSEKITEGLTFKEGFTVDRLVQIED